jgi:corrinoid protein of di/trimethylamine methyltransferase
MSRAKLLTGMAESVVEGDIEAAVACAQQSLAQGVPPLEAVEAGYAVGMGQVGRLYEAGDYFLPDLVMAGEAMKAALQVLEPEIRRRGETQERLGLVLIGSVEGDIHEIGKNLVAMMLTIGGFQVVDLGVDVKDEVFVEKARESHPDLIGMSALLTTTMLHQRRVIELLQEAGLRDQIKVIIGGCPVTKAWAKQIGADGYAGDALAAVTLAKNLLAATQP